MQKFHLVTVDHVHTVGQVVITSLKVSYFNPNLSLHNCSYSLLPLFISYGDTSLVIEN